MALGPSCARAVLMLPSSLPRWTPVAFTFWARGMLSLMMRAVLKRWQSSARARARFSCSAGVEILSRYCSQRQPPLRAASTPLRSWAVSPQSGVMA